MPTLRPLTAADLDAAMDIWLAANLQAHSFIPAAYWQNAAPEVLRQLPQAEVHVLEQNGLILGFIGLVPSTADPSSAFIAGLFVQPAAQSQGFGHLLLEQAKQAYPKLILRVYRQNEGARRFYQREGFRQTAASLDEQTVQEELTMLFP